MARFKGKDNLDSLKGELKAAFRAITLTGLQLRFFTAAAARKKDAVQALERFYQAVGDLSVSESEFKRRPHLPSDTLSLMANLRDPQQLTILREFNSAREKLLDIDPRAGRQIIRLVEKNIATPK